MYKNPAQKIVFDEAFYSEALINANGGEVMGGSVNRGFTVAAVTDHIDYTDWLPHPVNDFTIRIKGNFTMSGSSSGGSFFQLIGAGANSEFIKIHRSAATDQLVVRIANGSAYRDFTTTNIDSLDGEVDIFATRTGDTIAVYVNGVAASGTKTGSAITSALLLNQSITRTIGGVVFGVLGTYERVTMWSRKLADEDIEQLTNGEKIAPLEKLDIFYPFEKELGTTTKTTPDVISGYDLTLAAGSAEPRKLTNRNGYFFDTTNDTMTATIASGYFPSCGFFWFDYTPAPAKSYSNYFSFGTDVISCFLYYNAGAKTTSFVFKVNGNTAQALPSNITVNDGPNFLAFSYRGGVLKIMLNERVIYNGAQVMTTTAQTLLSVNYFPVAYGINNNMYALGFGSGEPFTENDMLELMAIGSRLPLSGSGEIDQDSLIVDHNYLLNTVEDQGPNGLDGTLTGDMALVRGRRGYGVLSEAGTGTVEIADNPLFDVDAATFHILVEGSDVILDDAIIYFLKGVSTGGMQYMFLVGRPGVYDNHYVVKVGATYTATSVVPLNGLDVSVVTLTKSAGTSRPKIYINGVYQSDTTPYSAVDFTSAQNDHPLTVGGVRTDILSSRSPKRPTYGFVMYSKEQTAEEVADTAKALMNRLKF